MSSTALCGADASAAGQFQPQRIYTFSRKHREKRGEAKGQAGNQTPAQGRAHPARHPWARLLSGFSVRSESSPALLHKVIRKATRTAEMWGFFKRNPMFDFDRSQNFQ